HGAPGQVERGADFISVAGGITPPAWLSSDAGHDALPGGGGDTVLLGGPGGDDRHGARRRDLLIGGLGADLLNRNGGDGRVLARTPAFDADQTALAAALAEWPSARGFTRRVAKLRDTYLKGAAGGGGVRRRRGGRAERRVGVRLAPRQPARRPGA